MSQIYIHYQMLSLRTCFINLATVVLFQVSGLVKADADASVSTSMQRKIVNGT